MNTDTCTVHDESSQFQDFNTRCYCVKQKVATPYDAFFSQTQVFLSSEVINRIKKSITFFGKLMMSEVFKKDVFKDRYDEIQSQDIEGGVLMSYDFHIEGDIPKLIEINTNAGGAFINYELLNVANGCCKKTEKQDVTLFEEDIVSMFRKEFSKKSSKTLESVVIVDEKPEEQFLYPEFLLCKSILEKHGLKVFIADPKDVMVSDSSLYVEGIKVDLMYNRLTDFYFGKEEHKKFLTLGSSSSSVITPNSNDHALFANKLNFISLQNRELLSGVLSDDEVEFISEMIPETVVVNALNEEFLWANRKKYFFKPYSGFGGRGAYNGRGLTKQTWENIKAGNYLAQAIVAPNVRTIKSGEESESYKFDIRAYSYRGEVLLTAARVYQGQTTNFRTEGGGFAPVLITKE